MMMNPVLAKELRDRVRTWRSPAIITFYLSILLGIGWLFFFERTMNGIGGPRAYRMGMELFNFMAFLQLLLIAFLTPGLTAGVISGERERQTLPLLMITRLSPFKVTVGKLLSAISYILFLVILALPVYSVVFFFGRVSMGEFLQAAGIYLATTMMLGSIGLLCSSIFRRTTVAVVVTYGITFIIFFGTIFGSAMIQRMFNYNAGMTGPPPVPFLAYFNPLVALGSGLPMEMKLVNGTYPIKMLTPWQVHLILDAVIIAIALGLTMWLIHPLRAGLKRRG